MNELFYKMCKIVEKIKTRHEDATKGPYSVWNFIPGNPRVNTPDTHPNSPANRGTTIGSGGYCRGFLNIVLNTDNACNPKSDIYKDAEFFAHSWQDIKDLLEYIDLLDNKIDTLETQIENFKDRIGYLEDKAL